MNEKQASIAGNTALLNTYIKGMTQDSREVGPGDLFVALKGLSVEGSSFIPAALQKGAFAALLEVNNRDEYHTLIRQNPSFRELNIIPYENLRENLGYIASHLYQNPSNKLSVIGITGTNGKTSCSHFIAQLMEVLGQKCAVMGTLGSGFLSDLVDHHCTTPDAINTQKELARFYQLGARTVAMEVTSHALSQKRVNGCRFHTGIFTNLTRDHLDYHGDMETYFAAKQELFLSFKPKHTIINLDDDYGQKLWNILATLNRDTKDSTGSTNSNMIGYSIMGHPRSRAKQDHSIGQYIGLEEYKLDPHGIQARLYSPFGTGEFKCSLLGHFNLSNILAAITALCLQGFSLKDVLEAIPALKTASGRMVRLGGDKGTPLVVVDYAHSPDSLRQVLSALRPHCKGKLWCVFGCGGDRDRGKRPLMAAVVEQLSDRVVLTQDNPRTEDPQLILQETLQGFIDPTRIYLQPDRALAIEFAVQSADPEDLVLVAGKGHENYQIIGDIKYPFDDQLVATQALARRK